MSAIKEAAIDPSLVARMKKKASPAKKRRIPLSSVGTKEADKLRKESNITPPSPTKSKPKSKSPEPRRSPSKPRRNSHVQDIVDGLRQILDAYDGSMGGSHAKRRNSSPHAKTTSSTGGTDAQRKVEKNE